MQLHEAKALIQRLPARERVLAVMALEKKLGPRALSNRDPAKRAFYASRPADYAESICGLTLRWLVEGRVYDQLLRVLDTFLAEPFLICAGAHGLGKTLLMAVLGLWHHDAVGAQADAQGRESGSRTLLLGPTETQVYQSIYSKILTLALATEQRGFGLPAGRLEKTPRWQTRAEWCIEAITPGHATGDDLSHRAGGRHGDNVLALMEEAEGVRSPVINAMRGSTSGGGPGITPGGGWQRNSAVMICNPSNGNSEVSALARGSTWRVVHLSALDHPNVLERRRIVPGGAVSVRFVDDKVAEGCSRLGPYPDVTPDLEKQDFVYALPERVGEEGGGPRADGFPGHADAELAVYRPGPLAVTQVLGEWPAQDDSRLFIARAWDEAVARWKRAQDPSTAPSAIGLDSAFSERETADDAIAAPRWGPDAFELLARWDELREKGDVDGLAKLAGASRVGRLRVAPHGDGERVAGHIWTRWPHPGTPWHVDDGGGQDIIGYARRNLRLAVGPVSFGAAAPAPVEGQLWAADNVRAAMHFLLASCVNRGLVDLPDDPELRKEAMVLWTVPRASKAFDVKERAPGGGWRTVARHITVRGLPPKDELRRILGRSPDRLDAVALALWRPEIKPPAGGAIPASRVAPVFRR